VFDGEPYQKVACEAAYIYQALHEQQIIMKLKAENQNFLIIIFMFRSLGK